MDITKTLQNLASYAEIRLRKDWPTIATFGGIGCILTGTVLACKATAKLEETKEEALSPIYTIKTFPEEYPSEKAYKKELTEAYIHGGWCFVKSYAPAVLFEIMGITMISSAHFEMKNRYSAATAAFNAVQQRFNDYRRRVIDEEGLDADRRYRGLVPQKIVNSTVDEETGEVKKEETSDILLDDPNSISTFARFFDDSSPNYCKDDEYNVTFLKLVESRCNQLLHDRGFLFLNEVYAMIGGIDSTKLGQVVGWFYDPSDPNLSNHVSFDINRVRRQVGGRYGNRFETAILVDFNLDGDIMDYIVDVPCPKFWREPDTNIIHEV